MRRTYNSKILFDADNKFYGFDLGYAYCGEQERGIKKIQEAFNVDITKMGIDRYLVNNIPNNFRYERFKFRKRNYLGLFFSAHSWDDAPIKELMVKTYNLIDDDKGFATAWDDKAFAICVTEKYIDDLSFLIDCFTNNKITIGLSRCENPYGRQGIAIINSDSFSEDERNVILEEHIQEQRLLDSAEQCGIYDVLEKAGKYFCALIPNWFDPEFHPNNRTLETKYPVVFFLNPSYQHLYNSGWFTVEELIDWANDKGCVMK